MAWFGALLSKSKMHSTKTSKKQDDHLLAASQPYTYEIAAAPT